MELNIIKDRVRNLIGDSHWGEEGKYKEAILRNVIKRFLPSNLSIGTGFIIKSPLFNSNSSDIEEKYLISNQIDIIIYDNTAPVLFSEGDFVIVTDKNTKAIIEVKTKIRNNNIRKILKKAKENGKLVKENIFNGVFSYEYEGKINTSKSIDNALKDAGGYVNHISLGPNIFIKFWEKENAEDLNNLENNCKSGFYNIYKLENLSFSYFISNLLELICASELDDRWWLLYPIEETKEKYRIRTICLR